MCHVLSIGAKYRCYGFVRFDHEKSLIILLFFGQKKEKNKITMKIYETNFIYKKIEFLLTKSQHQPSIRTTIISRTLQIPTQIDPFTKLFELRLVLTVVGVIGWLSASKPNS